MSAAQGEVEGSGPYIHLCVPETAEDDVAAFHVDVRLAVADRNARCGGDLTEDTRELWIQSWRVSVSNVSFTQKFKNTDSVPHGSNLSDARWILDRSS